MKKVLYLSVIVCAIALSSCKKESHTTSTVNLLKDSVYDYAKEDYLWFNQLPTYNAFNPRGFSGSSDLYALQAELNALSQYAINPATNLPYEYDKYSPVKQNILLSMAEQYQRSLTERKATLDWMWNITSMLMTSG